MARDVISTCPVCQGELTITRLQCRSCGTGLEGEFGVGRFGRLGREQLAFLESFLRSRGNLKEMERELGISYPTVRGRLETLLRALDLAEGSVPLRDDEEAEVIAEPMAAAEEAPETEPDLATDEELASERRRILERLARREISADEAAAALRGMTRS
jgi:hypothetical protein